jgi:tetratricopeptide (TPR) repeat protein
MRQRRVFSSAVSAAGMALALSAGAASPAAGQIARVRVASADAPKLLVVTFQRERNDSLLAVQVSDAIRERIRNVYLTRFNPILRDGMCRALTESGFPCDVPLEPTVVRQLARFLNARLIIEGNVIPRGQDSVLIIARLVEAAGATPQSATATVTALRSRAAGTGGDLANRLADSHRSFEDVQQCRQHLEAQRYEQAVREATDALRRHPSSSAALLCLAGVLRAQNAGTDTVEATLRRALAVDSLNTTVMRQLANIYQTAADTARLIGMLRQYLRIELADKETRIAMAQLYVRIGQQARDTGLARQYADSAVELVNQGLARSPADLDLLATKAIGLAVAQRWDSAAAVSELIASADSQKVDSLFVFRITNYLKAIPDSARLYSWTIIATQRLPSQSSYWFDLANLAIARGDTNRSLEAARQYTQLTNEGRGHLLIARVFSARMVADTADRFLPDSLYVHANLAAQDSTLRPFAAGFFLQLGGRAMGPGNYARAESLLTRARDYAGAGPLRVRSAWYVGVAQFQLMRRADSTAEASRGDVATGCIAVQRVRDLLPLVEQNVIAGVSENRQLANDILSTYLPAFRQRADAFARNYRCDRATGGGDADAAAPTRAPAAGRRARPSSGTRGGL